MRNIFNNGRYNRSYISPTLSKIFIHFENKPKIRTLNEYINKILCKFVTAHINYTVFTVSEIDERSIANTKEGLSSLESELNQALSLINIVIEECRRSYTVTFDEERTLNSLQDEMESLWARVDQLLCGATKSYASLLKTCDN